MVHDGLLKDDAVIVCNEEGKLACVECMDCIRGLPANRALRDSRSKYGMSYAVRLWSSALRRGFYKPDPAAVCGLEGQVLYPERFIYFNDKIVAVPIADGSAEAEDEKHE